MFCVEFVMQYSSPPNPNDAFVDMLLKKGHANPLAKGKSKQEVFWMLVYDIMAHLYKRYPDEMRAIEYEASRKRAVRFNAFGSDKSKNYRLGALMPDRLVKALDIIYRDDVMPVKGKLFLRGFMKRYPKFRIPEVI